MNKRLIPVTPLLDLLKIRAAELFGLRLVGVTALPVPEASDLLLQEVGGGLGGCRRRRRARGAGRCVSHISG